MQSLWSTEEVGEAWPLGAEDLAWLSGLPDAGKLGLAVQLMYWRRNGRFPDDEDLGHFAHLRGHCANIKIVEIVFAVFCWDC